MKPSTLSLCTLYAPANSVSASILARSSSQGQSLHSQSPVPRLLSQERRIFFQERHFVDVKKTGGR